MCPIARIRRRTSVRNRRIGEGAALPASSPIGPLNLLPAPATIFADARCALGDEGASVKKASEYRSHADECRAMARKVATADQRAQLMTMAETWDELAAEREQRLQLRESSAGAAAKARPKLSNSRKGAAE